MSDKLKDFQLNRYSSVREKMCREIVMLRGTGCKWRRCRFCDYHLDSSPDTESNFILNQEQLNKVTGEFGRLEVINSGSFVDIDPQSMQSVWITCQKKKIQEVFFECHWRHREAIKSLKEKFAQIGTTVKVKIGIETFDYLFRESYLDKGIAEENPENIAEYFDEVCLLFGIPGQSYEMMIQDIETGLHYFDRVYINIMQKNGKPIKPDPRVKALFLKKIYNQYANHPKIDILTEDTAFGVGGVLTKE